MEYLTCERLQTVEQQIDALPSAVNFLQMVAPDLLSMILMHLGEHTHVSSNVDGTCTVLHRAIRTARREAIYHQHQLTSIEAEGGAVLVDLVKRSQTTAALRLIDAGAPVEWQDDRGRHALYWAAGIGNRPLVDALIWRHKKIGRGLDVPNHEGVTALMVAHSEGFINIASALSVAGAQVEQQTAEGRNAISFAARRPQSSSNCAYLLRTLTDMYGPTSLQLYSYGERLRNMTCV